MFLTSFFQARPRNNFFWIRNLFDEANQISSLVCYSQFFVALHSCSIAACAPVQKIKSIRFSDRNILILSNKYKSHSMYTF